MHSSDFIQEMKQVLLENQQRLEVELAGLSSHTEMGNNYDDLAVEIQVDEVNKDLIARIKMDLEKIGKALEKVENGTYGKDDEGVEISEARLRVLPWADKAI